MSARFPFYYFFSISKLGAKRTRKISRLSSNMQSLSTIHLPRFSISLSWLPILGMGDYLFHQKASLQTKQQNSQLFSLGAGRASLSLSHPAAHLNARATSNPNLRCVVVHPWHVAQFLLLEKHLRTHTRRACADENSLKLHDESADITWKLQHKTGVTLTRALLSPNT